MTPLTMIEQLGRSGISVTFRDGELLAFPKSQLTDQQREFIQENKEILKAHLTTRPDLNPSVDLQNTEDCEAIPDPMTVNEDSAIRKFLTLIDGEQFDEIEPMISKCRFDLRMRKELFSLAQYAGAEKTVSEISALSDSLGFSICWYCFPKPCTCGRKP